MTRSERVALVALRVVSLCLWAYAAATMDGLAMRWITIVMVAANALEVGRMIGARSVLSRWRRSNEEAAGKAREQGARWQWVPAPTVEPGEALAGPADETRASAEETQR